MSNDTNTNSRRPEYTAYCVREYRKAGGDKKSDWSRVGIAWAHKDGDGFDVILDAIPLAGRIAIRKNKPKSEQAGEA